MNRPILALLFLLLSCAANAQYQYVPMPLSNGQWRYRVISEYQNSVSVEDYMLLGGGDTIIAGLTYKKIIQRRHYKSGTKPFSFPLQEVRGLSEDTYACLREHNKKVYWYMQGQDTVIYDFNLSVNDTLPTVFALTIPLPYQPVYVIHNIDTPTVNGKLRKRFSAHSITVVTNDTITVIEGIGSSNRGLIMNNVNGPYGSYMLTQSYYCFTVPGIQYPPNSDSCYYIWPVSTPASVNDAGGLKKLKAYPNPFRDVLNFDTENPGTLTIYNTTGAIVAQQTVNGPHTELNTSYISGGIYIITLKDNSGQAIHRQMLVK